MSDEKYVGAIAAAKQAVLIKAYVDSKVKKDFVVNITFDNTSAPAAIDDSNIAVFNASTDKTFAEISSAVAGGKNVYGMWNGHKWPLYLSSSTSHAFRGHIQLANLFGTVGLAIAICSIWQGGCDVTVSAGELPVPALDGTDDGKGVVVSGNKWAMKKAVVDDAMSATSTNPVQNKVVKAALDGKAGKGVAAASADGLMSAADKVKLDGVEDGATKTIVDDAMSDTSTNPVQNKVVMKYIDSRGTLPPVSTQNDTMLIQVVDGAYALRTKESIFPVDAALSGTSTNPVQNKAVKTELDKKLNLSGGTVTGSLTLKGAVFSDSGLSFGTGENIHFTKAADDAAKLGHGTADEHDNIPFARLKVAAPTEDDDAATKQYVDGKAAGSGAVRYDAAQTLDKAQQFQARKNIGAIGHDSPQFQGYLALAPANEILGSGVGLSPTGSGHNYTLNISDVDEGNPTLLTGVKTPTDADTNAATTVEYVKSKVASGGGGITPHIGDNGNWYLGATDTGKPSRGATGAKGDTGAPGKDGAGMDITGAIVGQIAKITAVDASGVPTAWSPADMPSGGSSDAVLYTAQTLTDAQKKQARENVDALGSVSPTIKDGTLFMETEGTDLQIQIQLNGNTSATGEDFVELDFLNIAPQAATDGVVIGGLANFGDAELVGLTDTAVSYAQLLDYTKPLMLTYNNNQVTGASYTDIRKAIERGRQIKLSVANMPDIIAANARNETNKSVLRFTHTDVGGDTVNISQYTVTAQASGLTAHVKSYEIAQ